MKNWLVRQRKKWLETDINLRYFLVGALFLGLNQGILSSTFNNFSNDVFHATATMRGGLEFPREFPGFLIIFITSLLCSLPIHVWGLIVGVLSCVGVMGLGFAPDPFWLAVIWITAWSMADHLFMPMESMMGLQLAKVGAEGRRLGQISGARNLALIGGSVLVFVFMILVPKCYALLYSFAAFFAMVSVVFFWKMRMRADVSQPNKRFVFRREYRLYYWLSILFGARKQIFLTFGPWVLITEFSTKPQTIAILLMIAAAIGVVFRQWFGIATDYFGERAVLVFDALVLLCVCGGYVFSRNVYLLFALYVIDNLMFATRIARTTYLNRVSLAKDEIQATISLGITIDHAVSMLIPLLGGLVWKMYGYQAVFLFASSIALLGLYAAMCIEKKVVESSVRRETHII